MKQLLVEFKKLKNGIKVLIVPNRHFSSVVIRLYALTGSVYETPANRGSSHLVEHLISRNIRLLAKKQNETWLEDDLINNFSATTTPYYSYYYFDCHKSDVGEAMNLLAKVFSKPNLKNYFRLERKIISAEIKDLNTDPDFRADQDFLRNYYGKHPLAYSVTGSEIDLKKLTPAKVERFFYNNYSASNLILVVAGNINVDRFLEIASTTIGKLKNHKSVRPSVGEFDYKKSRLKFFKNRENQISIRLSWPIQIQGKLDPVQWEFIASVLHNYFNFCLREQKGLGYYIEVFKEEFSDFLNLNVQASINQKNLLRFFKEFLLGIERFHAYFSEKELRLAKKSFNSNFNLDFEYPLTQAKVLGIVAVFHGSDYAVNFFRNVRTGINNLTKEEIINKVEALKKSSKFIHLSGDLNREDKREIRKILLTKKFN